MYKAEAAEGVLSEEKEEENEKEEKKALISRGSGASQSLLR